jgi:hypothetical protein
MSGEIISYNVDNDKTFHRAIVRAKSVTDDLRIPLTLIAKDFYKSEKAIFLLKGPGQYPDLAQSTIDKKEKAKVPIYPILMGPGTSRGRLAGSLTEPTHPDAVNQIVNKRTLVIGTTVPYVIYHQSDKPRTKIPLRKVLFIGPESQFANSDQQGRVGRWMNILNDLP